MIRGETKELGKQPVPVQLCPLKIPNEPFEDLKKPPRWEVSL